MISMSSVEEYLSGVKGDLQKGRYQIEHNRECNRKLVQDYVLHENKVIEILLSLRAEDFLQYYRMNMKNLNMKHFMSLVKRFLF